MVVSQHFWRRLSGTIFPFLIIYQPETLLLQNLIFEPMHFVRFFRQKVIEAEIVQQAVCNIKGKFRLGRMSPFGGLGFRLFAVYDKLEQSVAGLAVRQVKGQAIGKFL